MELLELYASRIDSEYIKFTLGMNVKFSMSDVVQFTLGEAIPFCDPQGNRVHKKLLYERITQLVKKHGEEYKSAVIHGVFIRVFYKDSSKLFESLEFPPVPNLFKVISDYLNSCVDGSSYPSEVLSLKFKQARIPNQVSSIRRSGAKARSFIVADLETILVDNIHKPYAGGFLLVTPGDILTSLPNIHTFFSEDLQALTRPTFSERMLFDFCSNVELTVKKYKDLRARTVYYHNLSRFDGVLLVKHYTNRGQPFKVKTLINLLSFCKDPECFFFLLLHFTGQLEQKNKTDCGIFPAVGGLERQPQGREVSKTGTLVSDPSRIPCLVHQLVLFKARHPSDHLLVVVPEESDKLVLTALGAALNEIFGKMGYNAIQMQVTDFYENILKHEGRFQSLYRFDMTRSLITIDQSSLIIRLESILGSIPFFDLVLEFLKNEIDYIEIENIEIDPVEIDNLVIPQFSIPPAGLLTNVLLNFELFRLDNEIASLYPDIYQNYRRHIHEIYIYNCNREKEISSLFVKLCVEGNLHYIKPGLSAKCFVGNIGLTQKGRIYVTYGL
ncbi:hypothetical protein OROMI_009300 [Orobanche minor]